MLAVPSVLKIAAVLAVLAVVILTASFVMSKPKTTTSITSSSISISSTSSSSSVTSTSSTTLTTATSTLSTTSTSATTTIPGGDTAQDYNQFIAPYFSNIEKVREWMMANYTGGSGDVGYNASMGAIQGDNLCGGHIGNDITLDDPNFVAANTLDYLNAQLGSHTRITQTINSYLSLAFTPKYPPGFSDCADTGVTSWTYNGNPPNKREFLFGSASQYYPADLQDCVRNDGTYVFNVQYPVVLAVEVPNTNCVVDSTGGQMNELSPYIDYLWLKGHSSSQGAASVSQAKKLFNNTITNWTTYNLPNGQIGGYWQEPFGNGLYCNGTGKGNTSKTRDLVFWLETARATGLWAENATTKRVAQQVENQLWYNQEPNGQIWADYIGPNCGPGGGSAESSAVALIATDPRLPTWFNTTN